MPDSLKQFSPQVILPPLILLSLLAAAFFILPPYHQGNMARIMVLACFACAYNIAYGYCGLLSLGHALFFISGMYGFGFAMLAGVHISLSVLVGVAAGACVGFVVGWLALAKGERASRQEGRQSGAAFMIITLMLAQAGYLAVIYFGDYTRADEGFSLPAEMRQIDLADETMRYFLALAVFAIVLIISVILKRTKLGSIWSAIRENPMRAALSGYNVFYYSLLSLVISASLSALAGAFYVWLFGYVGAGYGQITYSILPLLWVLVGGVATILGPFIGTALMFYAIDTLSDYTNAYLGIVGVLLVLLMLWGKQGIVGSLQKGGIKWLT